MLKYMLDTNIVIYVIKQKPPQVRTKFNSVATQLCVSSVTVAELIYGAENSQYPEKNLYIVENFLSRLQILDYGLEAAIQYGNIKAILRKTGQLISDNDLHIVAHARSKGLILVTNNTKEFERVPALQLENWVG
ncbi:MULTISPECIES: type II toxin-antitoxin system VapC family toxin [unclassified Acinetobacter]|uniref:type II toxin-antitoxin system tRNA(fMet)-specific endonuclease VapC n=1 Tax=unclassified Acinetobacter TaxID=196816 RepID=UPI00244B166C|nr:MULTISPECIES: type II toxin-antitoxin system VapC family toxin [unclassified Acinetobacter]MDH0033100.1 type II toxin-antitoxin system VapC family toxin [Acinetobacter sp. GD04021]MDH0888460.1 type II toxin-antitoxin system VapC family toxin [Acinetobacter sp. GD03873]MDH1084857.1 type II toxin-antitoxin system VapC family toxin [Acinetobacter sp. GD03983]MDH2191747.1 type II toxin-antitoxin system VapC family toxin [Acinetobacter sp. GD03645]MDH2205370.1 type II toxin-antitoxin system VapC